MTAVRRHLRLWATAWLVFQVVSLSAFMPRDCCANHHASEPAQQTCHETAAIEVGHCQMEAADGQTCSMHRGHASTAPAPASDTECSLGGTCGGPIAVIAALLSNQGVLTGPVTTSPDIIAATLPAETRDSARSLLVSPDPPPPRA